MTEKARKYAKEKHEGQLYNGRSYFTGHLLEVVEESKNIMRVIKSVKDVKVDDEILEAVALLHDVVEDTDATEEEIKELFGEEVAEAVARLTKTEGQSERNYFRAVSENIYSKIVKAADRAANLKNIPLLRDEEQRTKLIGKYNKQLRFFDEYNIFYDFVRLHLRAVAKMTVGYKEAII